MTTEASESKELTFADLKQGQSIYLRLTKDAAKIFSSNDTVQGFHIMMVIDENSKQAGLPVLRKRITAKSMVEETLWEINVIPETTMVITPTSTCLLYTSPSPRDGLLSRMPSSA